MAVYYSNKIQAPNVMSTYGYGRYYMVFDWLPANFDWQNSEQSRIGYAVDDRPERYNY